MEWPLLGSSEDLHTEFKRAGALRDLSSIVREAVAFLNAEGGTIWIGVGETNGVADTVEAIVEPDRESSRLQDAFIDLVEPQPVIGRGKEVEIEKVPFPGDPGHHLLRVTVRRGERGPYALLRQSARAFLKRSGSRVHAMTRAEIFGGASRRRDLERDDAIAGDIEAELRSGPDVALKVIVRPNGPGISRLILSEEGLLPLLRDPRASGNRPHGWNFADPSGSPTPLPREQGRGEGYRFGEKDAVQWLEIWERGDVRFFVGRRDRLYWMGQPGRLWPFAVMEFPVSVARLARTLYSRSPRQPTAGAEVVLGLRLQVGADTLTPFSPNSIGYQFGDRARHLEDDDFVTAVMVSWSELRESPDGCAYHLVRQTYRAFGFEDGQIPGEFDPNKGLIIPS